jgi:hypothetical protein
MRGRARPKFYSDRLFVNALVIMIVQHLHGEWTGGGSEFTR